MKGPKRKPTPGSEPLAADGSDVPERWSARRKTELVLRLLRGEALDAVSRESQVPAHELESWKRVFLEQGTRGLRIRGEPEERELTMARAKIGELMMRLELAEDLIKKGASRTSGRGARDERPGEPGHATALSAEHDLRGVSGGPVECVRDRPCLFIFLLIVA
jgi:transposase